MKKVVIAIMKSVLSSFMSSKVENPIEWKFTPKKIGKLIYEVHLMAFIEYPWHLYAHHSLEDSSWTTIIKFQENSFVIFSGKLKVIGHLKEGYDDVFKIYNTIIPPR